MENPRPRIVSEVRKTLPNNRSNAPLIARMAGTLVWKTGLSEWHLVQAEIRQGRLVLWSQPKVYFPLQRLNLEAAVEGPRTFTLTRHTRQLLATFQTLTDEEYGAWVKALAVEILRQTPIHEVRFLDIIGITRKKSHPHTQKPELSHWFAKTIDYHSITADYDMKNVKIRRAQKLRPKLPLNTWSRTQSLENIRRQSICCGCQKDVSDESGIGSGDENNNNDKNKLNFVSVRDKKQFFESLNNKTVTRSLSLAEIKPEINHRVEVKTKHLIRPKSEEQVQVGAQVQKMLQLFEKPKTNITLKRSISMINTEMGGGVHYENADQNNDESAERLLNQRRLQRGERKLSKLRIQMAEVEDTIKVIADRIFTIRPSSFKRREGIEIFTTLKRRLEEENARMERLHEESSKVIDENKTLKQNLYDA